MTPERMTTDRPPKCLRQKYKGHKEYSSLAHAWYECFRTKNFQVLEDPERYLVGFARSLRRQGQRAIYLDAAGYIDSVTGVLGAMRRSMRQRADEDDESEEAA